jgi:hypothetical protein
MELNINEINYNELGLNSQYQMVLSTVKQEVNRGNKMSDKELFHLIYSDAPKFQASSKTYRETISFSRMEASRSRKPSPSIISRVRRELYNFICTDSEKYKDVQAKAKGSVNLSIVSISVYIANKVGHSIEIVTTIITAVLLMFANVGHSVMCSSIKPL